VIHVLVPQRNLTKRCQHLLIGGHMERDHACAVNVLHNVRGQARWA
jgi:hypothetical protein